MRRPPSPTRILAYPVTGGLGLLAIAVTSMISLGRFSLDRFDLAPIAFWQEPWRLFLSVLPHIGFLHLAFNVYWLWVLGTVLEEVFGHAKTAALILLFAGGSMAAEYAIFTGGVGLSGVGYGLVALLWVLSRRDRRFADAVDERTVRVFVLWFFFCIALTVSKAQPVANVAHGVGALLGLLVGAILVERRAAFRALAGLGVATLLAGSAAGATTLRPRVNLASNAGQRSAYDGYLALMDGRNEEAVRHYLDAVALSRGEAGYWFNLGLARQRLEQHDESLVAYKKALELDPTNDGFRRAVITEAQYSAYKAQMNQQWDEAIRLYREALAVEPDDGRSWFNLSLALTAAGRLDEAAQARVRANAPLPADDTMPP